ncbi:preprotein translocase subunit SecG [Micrococcales bacterium 31B]|nr:preprotein translocase subunit SecG [Micrococcales bacterium 31B]
MDILRLILMILLVLTSVLLVISVLMHKGQGGGLSDMFGGGISGGAGSSGVAARNLGRITIVLAVVWGFVIVLLGLIERFYPTI